MIYGLLILVGLASLSTRLMIHLTRRLGLQDVPNERSSHRTPTPRGGGLAIVGVCLLGWAYCIFREPSEWASALAAIGFGAAAVAWIGWIDDRKGLKPLPRLLVQLLAATGVVYCAGPTSGGPLLGIVGVVYLTWMTNIFNFMDGIDGLAAGQAVSAGATLAAIGLLFGEPSPWTLAWAILAAGSLGFLFHNWSPARIFMGDVGSGFLGFAIGALSWAGVRSQGGGSLVLALIVMAVFVTDSSLTLLGRAFRGQPVWRAHREHGYQKAVQDGHPHARVSSWAFGFNVLWGAPLAIWASRSSDRWAIALGLAYAPLLMAGWRFGSGRPEGWKWKTPWIA